MWALPVVENIHPVGIRFPEYLGLRAIDQCAEPFARVAIDVGHHDLSAIVQLDRKPLPALLRQLTEHAKFTVEPGDARYLECLTIDTDGAGRDHVGPRVVVNESAKCKIMTLSAVVQHRRVIRAVDQLQVEHAAADVAVQAIRAVTSGSDHLVGNRPFGSEIEPVVARPRHAENVVDTAVKCLAGHVGQGAMSDLESLHVSRQRISQEFVVER